MRNNLKTATEVIEEVTKVYVDKLNEMPLGQFARAAGNDLKTPFDMSGLVYMLQDSFSYHFFYHKKIQALPVLACTRLIQDEDTLCFVLDRMNECSIPFSPKDGNKASDYVAVIVVKERRHYGLQYISEAELVEAKGFENIQCVADIQSLVDKDSFL